MTALLYVLGVLLFVVGVALSVGLHELGHLIPGKLFDVKVTQYFIGFGRTLWSRQRGETEYGVKAIPLGGYVKLVGMMPPRPGEQPGQVRDTKTGMFAQLVDDARSAEYEHVGPDDHGRLFYNKHWAKRVVIMASGVTINLVLAFVLFAIAFSGIGVQTETTTVGLVADCVVPVRVGAAPRACTAQDTPTPAKQAGFRVGDRFVSFNGHATTDWAAVQREIRANGSKPATVVVERQGRQVTLHPRTVVNTVQAIDGSGRLTKAGFLGVTAATARERQGLGFVASTMVTGTKDTLVTLGHLPNKVFHVARAALGLEKRDPNSPMSVVGAGRIAGEVASQPTPVLDRLFQLLSLLAALNLFLGLINLVPLPPFDGGGIATTLFEAARRGVARLLRRPDPGAVDVAKLLPVTYVMAAVILVVSLVLILADIVAPVSLS